jgi:outer membrane lipoprotein-sorting protein
MNIMKSIPIIRSLFLFLVVAVSPQLSAQENPKEILSRAVNNMMTDHMELSMDIRITDEKGRVKEKAYDILMAKFGEVEKTMMVMQKPERAKGVTVVITSLPGETGLIEVFTPANGKVRKMQATPENMERVGSNMVLSEYTSQDLNDLNYSPAERREVDGRGCHVFRVNDPSDPQGLYAEFLVEESTYHILQIRFFDKQGNNTNITSLSDYQPIPGVEGKIHAMHIEAKDFKENTETKMEIQKVSLRPDLKEEDFELHESSD